METIAKDPEVVCQHSTGKVQMSECYRLKIFIHLNPFLLFYEKILPKQIADLLCRGAVPPDLRHRVPVPPAGGVRGHFPKGKPYMSAEPSTQTSDQQLTYFNSSSLDKICLTGWLRNAR